MSDPRDWPKSVWYYVLRIGAYVAIFASWWDVWDRSYPKAAYLMAVAVWCLLIAEFDHRRGDE